MSHGKNPDLRPEVHEDHRIRKARQPCLFHDQDRAAIQRIPRGGQDCPEPRDHMRRARVLESKQDDSRHPVVRESSDLADGRPV